MIEYCEPISWSEWHEPRSATSWHETYEDANYWERRARLALTAALAAVKEHKLVIEHEVTSLTARASPTPAVQLVASEQSLEQRFTRLVTAWREDIENVSSLTRILSHPAYQHIIDLGRHGEPVVPLILKELHMRRGYWATALQAITGENPVPTKSIGNPTKVREAWLEWGRHRGYVLDNS